MYTCQKGLTLVELLTVLLLAGLLLALSVAGLRPLLEQQRRETLAHELAHSLRAAKVEAIQRNRRVLVLAEGGNWAVGWRVVDDLSGRGGEDPGNPVLRVSPGITGVRAVATANLARQAAFDYLGRPVLPRGGSLAASLHLCDARNPNNHLRVVIARTGRIRISREPPAAPLCLTPPV